MATTGELRAIMQELDLVEIGDAASYLGEEAIVVEESPMSIEPTLILITNMSHLATCDCASCQAISA